MKHSNHASPYRFIICFCSCLLIFINVGLLSNVFSIYFPFIMETHGFSNTQLSLLNTMRSITALFCMFISDKYYEKLNLKAGALLALFCAAASYFLYGTTSTPDMYYIAAAISGIAYGLGGVIPASILIRRWFPSHASTAMGLAASGTGVASILGPIIITELYQSLGLSKTFFLEMILMIAGMVLLFLFIRNEPPNTNAEAEDASSTSAEKREKKEVKLPFSARLRIIIGLLFVGVIGLTSYSSFSMLYTSTGHSIEHVSAALSFVGGMLIVGKCSFGIVSDRFGTSRALAAYCLFLLTGQIMCCFAPLANQNFILATFFVFGLGAAIPGVSLPILAADFSTPKTYAKTLKNYQITYTLGGLFSSTLPGIIADVTGSYVPAHLLFTVCAAGIFLLLVPVHRKYALSAVR